MGVAVEKRDLTPQPALIIRRRIPVSEIPRALDEIFPKVYGYCQQHGIAFEGMPFTRYSEMGDGKFTIEAGVIVRGPARGEGEIERIELPGGPAATATHLGTYDRLKETYDQIEAWMKEQGVHATSGPWEVYFSDPSTTPKDQWRTDIFWPVAS